MNFKVWLEQEEIEYPKMKMDTKTIPWETWSEWDHHFDLFVYGDLLDASQRPMEQLEPARVRGMIRVFDIPDSSGRRAKLGIRHTGRLEDIVNGAITHIPSEEVEKLANKYQGYDLGKITAVRIDPDEMIPLKKSQKVYYLIHPDKATKKIQPDPGYLREVLKSAYQISPAFGEEFVRTTYRLPKRGRRLVRITR